MGFESCVNSNHGAAHDEVKHMAETMRVRVAIREWAASIFDALDRPAESEFSTAKNWNTVVHRETVEAAFRPVPGLENVTVYGQETRIVALQLGVSIVLCIDGSVDIY